MHLSLAILMAIEYRQDNNRTSTRLLYVRSKLIRPLSRFMFQYGQATSTERNPSPSHGGLSPCQASCEQQRQLQNTTAINQTQRSTGESSMVKQCTSTMAAS
jgi:hypothetical protein